MTHFATLNHGVKSILHLKESDESLITTTISSMIRNAVSLCSLAAGPAEPACKKSSAWGRPRQSKAARGGAHSSCLWCNLSLFQILSIHRHNAPHKALRLSQQHANRRQCTICHFCDFRNGVPQEGNILSASFLTSILQGTAMSWRQAGKTRTPKCPTFMHTCRAGQEHVVLNQFLTCCAILCVMAGLT